MMSTTFLHELMIMMNMIDGEHVITGAHYKNLTVIEVDGERFERMGQAAPINLAEPSQLASALGDVNAGLVAEISQLTGQLNAGALREGELVAAAEQADQERQALISTLGQRTAEIADLQGQISQLQEQLAAVPVPDDQAA